MTTNSGAVDGALAASIDDQLPGAVLPEVPRRFAIFTYDADDEPELYLWGLQIAERAFAFSPNGGTTHRSGTAERMERVLNLAMDADLVWLDT
jgi:hypothetical protein